MKLVIPIILLVLTLTTVVGQESIKLYDPEANAMIQLNDAISQAAKQEKHVLVQVGGNWCPWCIKLHSYVNENHALDSIITADYIPVKINYSKENKNPEVLSRLENPQRFGFPVLIILDEKGKRIHTQDTGLLESGKGYDYDKVKRFLLSWNRIAVGP